jgi:alanine racemase
VHLKIDTGMHRYGLLGEEAVALAQRIVNDPHLTFDGFFSHFATADEEDDEFTREQVERFQVAWTALMAAGLEPRYVHLANSAGTLRGAFPVVEGKRALARVGLALHGLSPSSAVAVSNDFRPVMTFKSRIARVFTLPEGAGVSYGLTYRSPSAVRCATLPVGYADGFSRHLSNKGWALVRGVPCPIRGRVCMDQSVIEVEGAGDVSEGDEVILIGDGSDGAMTADQVAEICGTINYEVIASLSTRVPRIYVQDGRPVAVSDLRGLVELDDPAEI